MQVHWLRLIVDEGHVMGKKQTKQATLATYLLAERKWGCTGTPTPGNTLNYSIVDQSWLMYFNGRPNINDLIGSLLDNELENLFGLMLFLNHQPYCDRKNWTSYIVRPLKQRQSGAPQRLEELLKETMVKNKQEDIDKEIALPKCHVAGIHQLHIFFYLGRLE